MGEYDLNDEFPEPYSFQDRKVQIVASHPKFDPKTFEYDLALLRWEVIVLIDAYNKEIALFDFSAAGSTSPSPSSPTSSLSACPTRTRTWWARPPGWPAGAGCTKVTGVPPCTARQRHTHPPLQCSLQKISCVKSSVTAIAFIGSFMFHHLLEHLWHIKGNCRKSFQHLTYAHSPYFDFQAFHNS